MERFISEEDANRYAREGYLVVRGLLSGEEAASLREEAHRLMERLLGRYSIDATWESGRAVEGAANARLFHCHNVQFHSAAFTRLLVDDRIARRLGDLIGPNVELHHTKLFIKPPGHGSPFPMHQDYPYFPHARHSMIAMILHLDDAPLEKGCVRVMPGSHREGPLPHLSQGGHHLPVDRFPIDAGTPIEASAGDAILFSYFLVHGSGLNRSHEARTSLLIQARDPSDDPLTEEHRSPGQGMILRGIDPRARLSPHPG